jgi:hypothetical protein
VEQLVPGTGDIDGDWQRALPRHIHQQKAKGDRRVIVKARKDQPLFLSQ